MFDLDKFYSDAEAGNEINEQEVIDYIGGFETVIIWGAGNMGTALGKYLIEHKVSVNGYWDQNYREIQERNGIKVYNSFETMPIHRKETTLLICGIVNGTHSHHGQIEQCNRSGYTNIILGMPLYEGLVCKMRKNGIFDVKQCTGTGICNFNTCKKYLNILSGTKEKNSIENVIHVLEFVISRKCTLDCGECGQRVGRIKREFPEKYVIYPYERIIEDIDIIMDNVDAVGTFSIIGGEPFTHPQLAEIIQHCLTKDNVGIISITTNGICKMTEAMLKKMKSDRVKINFSNYTQSLQEEQKKLFYKNVELVKACGLNCNVATPVWGRVIDMIEVNQEIPESYYKITKTKCQFGPSVSNGTFFACPVSELYDKLEEVDVSKDKIVLSQEKNVREKIHELLCKDFYESCKHRCGNQMFGEEVAPGAQY